MAEANLQPTLENSLVMIRPMKEQDFEALFDVANDPLIWEQHTDDRFKKEVFTEFFRNSIASRRALIVIDKKSGDIIGTSRYQPLDGADTAVEIGWSFLGRDYWGGRYNKAVKTLLITYAFTFYDDIIFYIDRNNVRSQKAAE